MRFLGIDYGLKRVGVAISDELAMIARPLETLKYSRQIYSEIAELVDRNEVGGIVVGIPVDLDGSETESTRRARNFIKRLQEKVEVPVEEFDEALSSRKATSQMVAAGTTRKRRRTQGELDRWAAAIILQEWLDQRDRSAG